MSKKSAKTIAMSVLGIFLLVMVGYLVGKAQPADSSTAQSHYSGDFHDTSSAADSHNYSIEKGDIDVNVRLGSDKISVKDGVAYMLITLKGDKIVVDHSDDKRLPLNLSIVLDRSGSMQGQKLDNVKRALEQITPLLDYEDRVSLVVYDDYVETVYNAEHFEKIEFLNAVERVYSGGSTNLEGGLREGLYNVNKKDSRDYANRVILLSDGLANVGVSDAYQLANIVEDLAGDSITISTIGVGSDYDEHLMTKVAMAGRGNYYFLEDPRDAQRIFTQEFESVLNTVARDITVEFNIDGHFEVVQGIGYELKETSSFRPHDIYSEKEVSYLFEISAKDLDQLNSNNISLANLKVSFENALEGKTETITIPINIQIVTENVNPLADDIVYEDYMQSYKAEILWDIYEDLDKMDNDMARDRSDDLILELEKANSRLPGEFDEDLETLKEKKEFLEELEYEDVNAAAEGRIFQKSNQYDSYQKVYSK